MSSKKKETEEVLVDVEQVYSKTEAFITKHQKNITIGGTAILVVLAGILYYFNLYLPPLEKEAEKAIYAAQGHFERDSFQLAMYGDNQGNMGFEEIISEYGSTKVGNLAKYYMGISLLNSGLYEDAIAYLKSYSAKDIMTASIAEGAIGDAYSELGDFKKALSYYEKASKTNKNDLTTPFYLMKAGRVAEKLGENKKALSFYKEIKEKYATTQEGRSIDKYIARAEAVVK